MSGASKSSGKPKKRGKKTRPTKADLLWSTTSGAVPNMNRYITDNLPYTIQETVLTAGFSTTSTVVVTYASQNFTLSQLDQVGSYTALFDQYRFDEIELWLTPRTELNLGTLVSVIDYDDSTVLTTYASATDYQNALTAPLSMSHYRRFVPHAAVAAYSGTFVSFDNVTAPWIDCASPSVQHYGFKTACTVTTPAVALDLTIRYKVSFRNVR